MRITRIKVNLNENYSHIESMQDKAYTYKTPRFKMHNNSCNTFKLISF